MKKIDLVGKRFGRLLVLKDDGTRNKQHKIEWLCKCDCGNTCHIWGWSLTSNHTKSCGCLHKELLAKRKTTHGLYVGNDVMKIQGTPIGNTWILMIQRCYNPNATGYKYYGGRGITVCDEWLGEGGFNQFCKDIGERPDGMTLDRIDNDGKYKLSNCKWSTIIEQNNNKRRY